MAHLVKDYTKSPVRLAFGSTLKPSENVRLQAFEVSADGKQEMLHHLLAGESGRCLVFSRTKRGTERIARALTRQGINAAMIHGDRSQSQRTLRSQDSSKGTIACWWPRTWLRAEFTCRTSRTSSTTTCPSWPKTSFTAWGVPDERARRGVASTLFLREQRTELFQLERTLGIRIERMRVDSKAVERTAKESRMRADSAPTTSLKSRLVRLPGEYLQVQLET